MLQCFVCSPIPKVSEKKWATSQSFIWKEITTYRIGTLEAPLVRQADGELKKFFSKVDQPVETDPSAGMAMDMAGTYPSSCIVSAQTLLSGKDPQLTPARGSLHKLYKKKHGLGIHTYYVYILRNCMCTLHIHKCLSRKSLACLAAAGSKIGTYKFYT